LIEEPQTVTSTKVEKLIRRLVPTLYEDDRLLAVLKPAGVDSGGAEVGSGPGLGDWLGQMRGHRLHPANRLSRYESGVLLFGKDAGGAQHIRAGLKGAQVAQDYLAVVVGRMNQMRLEIDPVGGASRGRRGKKAASTQTGPDGGIRTSLAGGKGRRPARAGSSVVGRNQERHGRTVLHRLAEGDGRTLIRCSTTVRNTHALRAQLRGAGLRLSGDSFRETSGGTSRAELTFLHLTKMAFSSGAPRTTITITAPKPATAAASLKGRHDPERALHAALVRRLGCITEAETDCYRLITGSVEDVPGLTAEKFGEIVVLQVLEDNPVLLQSLRRIAMWYRQMLGVQAVYVKRFLKGRDRVQPNSVDDLHDPKPFIGVEAAPQFAITERGLRFAIRPHDGQSVGLFLDQRENRGRIRSLADGKDVLNLFAYTCGFSVAAAAGGARTVSVDVSAGHLEWGRTNFTLNGLDPSRHEFIRSDAVDFCVRADRRDIRFDLIVLDPPTFAHGRRSKGAFSITTDLAALIGRAIALLRPNGVLLISSNFRRMTLRGMRDALHEGAGGRRYKIMSVPPLPVDFAVDRDHAKALLVRFF